MWADAFVVILRAGPMAVEAFKKSPPPVQERSSLAAFKAQRGLASHGAGPRFGGCSGTWSSPDSRPSPSCSPGPAGAGGINGSPNMITTNSVAHGLRYWLLKYLLTTVVLGGVCPAGHDPAGGRRGRWPPL